MRKLGFGARYAAALLLAAALVFGLAACGGGDDSSGILPDVSGSGVSASQAGEEGGEAAASSEGAASGEEAASGEAAASGETAASGGEAVSGSGAGSAALEAAPPAEVSLGVYYCYDEARYPEDRAPYLELKENGEAVFRVHSGMELGLATGSYSVSGTTLSMVIDSLEIEDDFWNDDFAGLQFQVMDENNLKYAGDTYGLTLQGNLFTLEGAPVYAAPAPAPASNAETPASDSGSGAQSGAQSGDAQSDGGVLSGAISGALSGAVSGAADGDVSGGQGAAEAAGGAAHTIVAPGDTPPEEMNVGDSFTLNGIDLYSINYDPGKFSVENDTDESAVFTAVAKGKATISYALLPAEEGDEAPAAETYSIKIKDPGATSILPLILVGVGSLVLGGGLTFLLLTLLGRNRRGKKGDEEGEEAAGGGEADDGLPADDPKLAKKIAKQEKKAQKAADKQNKKADKAAKKAEKAQQEAEKAAAKAEKAELAVEVARNTAQAAVADDAPPPDEEGAGPPPEGAGQNEEDKGMFN